MTTAPPDLTRLVSLIDAAKAEADRVGAPAATVARHLDQAGREARVNAARGGAPNEGIRVDDLTTGNDK